MITYGDLNATSMLSEGDWQSQNFAEAGANILIGTLVDVGTSMYNSLVPEAYETSTRGILQSIGADGAVAAYDNNRDLINTLSFVGGVFIPGMAATKIARGVRAGIRGTGILGDMRHKEDLAKFGKLIEQGMEGTAEYRKVRNSIFMRGQAANIVDTAAAEMAIISTFNAHPFMEDYWEDPLKNFGIGMLIGGGIGGGINFLTTRSGLANVLGNTQAAALGSVRQEASLNVSSFADASSSMTALDNSASKLEAMAKNEGFNALTREYATSFAKSMRADIGRIFESGASQAIKDLPEAAMTGIRDRVTSPQFFGVDKVDFLKLPVGGYKQEAELNVLEAPIFRRILQAGPNKGQEKFIRNAYYSPELGGFVKKGDTLLASTAADILTPQELRRQANKLSKNRLSNGWQEAQALNRTADVEATYLTNMAFYSKLNAKELASVEMVHGDYPAVQGWLSAHQEKLASVQERLRDIDPSTPDYRAALDELTVLRDAKVKMFDGDRVRLVNVEELDQGVLPTAANTLDPSATVRPTFFEDVTKEITDGNIQPLLNSKVGFDASKYIADEFYLYVQEQTGVRVNNLGALHKIAPKRLEEMSKDWATDNAERLRAYATEGADLTPEATLMLLRWVGGRQEDKELFRNAMASARTLRRNMDSTTPFHEALSNILASPLTKRQSEILRKHSDAKGNIYLKRGMHSSATGDTSVSSYTFDEQIASGFGKVGTYKVSLDDVVGYIFGGEKEWLVGATTRDATDFAEATAKQQAAHIPPQPKSTAYKDLTARQAMEVLLTNKGDEIHRAIQGGMATEVAALRFNVSQEFAEMAGADADAFTKLFNYSQDGKYGFNTLNTISRWKGSADIDAALDPGRRTLQVSASEQKVLGTSGDLLAQHHDALKGMLNLSRLQKQALEYMDSASTERLNAKVAVADELMATVQRNWVETSVMAGQSSLLKKMYGEVVDGDQIKALRDGLNQFVNGKGGNPLYSSADFVTSRMGEVGRFVTDIGDMRGKIANKEFERLATPIANEFKKLMQDPAARTEFAVFDNLRQSHKGFAKYDPAQRTFVTLAEDGKTLTPITDYVVRSDAVDRALTHLDEAGSAIYDNQVTLNRIKGSPEPSTIGTWIPSQVLLNKELAYVVNHDDGSIKLLVGNNPEDLKTVTKGYSLGQNESILTRAELGQDKIARIQDTLQNLERADVSKLKKGTGLAAPDISPDRLADIINGLRDRINYQASAFVENSLTDVMTKLDYLSDFNTKYFANNNPNMFRRAVQQLSTQDTARDIKDTLLGRNSVYRNEFLGTLNKATSATIQIGLNAWNRAYEATLRPSLDRAGNLKPGARVDYDGFVETLKAQGIEDPFKAFHEAARPFLYERAKNSGYSVTPDRLINAGNALASTLALKFAEIAQPLVNMMSGPILATSAISRSIKGVAAETGRDIIKDSPIAIMTAGIRRAHSDLPENKRFMKIFEEEGLFDPIISEADEVIKLSRFGTGSLVGGLEKALDSKFIQIMSKPSEASEAILRKYTLMTGVDLGRRLYGPAASDRQLSIFARDFMKQSLGNYTTSQRPMMFQGTLGSAMGLFQTYMLTYAQSLYRHVDLKDYKGLGKTMLLQGGIFGAGSLPGFQPISHAIGEHFSDEHWDLTSGTYRALPDYLADMVIYGLPSNLAPDVHTRGDVSPRVPNSISTMVAPSMLIQSFETMFRVGKSMLQQDIGAGQAFMEALATQSVSRPIARMSELVTGRTTTGQGNQVAGPEEVWSWQGILARVASTRTLAESKTREAMHLNSYYGAIDSEARQAILGRMRTAIRAGNLDNDLMDDLAYSYLRVGTPQGFRQAVNQAIMEQENTAMVDLSSRLRGSPLMSILDDIE